MKMKYVIMILCSFLWAYVLDGTFIGNMFVGFLIGTTIIHYYDEFDK